MKFIGNYWRIFNVMKFSLILLSCSIATSMVSFGSNTVGSNPVTLFKQGKKLYLQEKYSEAVPIIKQAAELGDVEAQCKLAYIYTLGKGIPRDPKKSLQWYTKAAEQGDRIAQYRLGYMYDFGIGTDRNQKLSYKWYKKSAAQGLARSQYELAKKYAWGEATKKNVKEANRLIKKAADQGDHLAQRQVASVYLHNKNYNKAIHWYEKAAENGNLSVRYKLGLIHITRAPIKDEEKAARWFREALKNGHPSADNALRNFKLEKVGLQDN